MDVRIPDRGPTSPFLGARDLFETEYDLELPVYIRIRSDPDERTRTGHATDKHVLTISKHAATSAMARELALHEYAHMYRYECGHPSHQLRTEEAIYLALAGERVERRKLAHCYQIANHLRDIYADDVTFSVGPADKLVGCLESGLASAIADYPPTAPATWTRRSATSDPDITAVNAAFAVALCERHDLLDDDATLYDLAFAAARDAPDIDFDGFRRQFRDLEPEPDTSAFRRTMVSMTRDYCIDSGPAAD